MVIWYFIFFKNWSVFSLFFFHQNWSVLRLLFENKWSFDIANSGFKLQLITTFVKISIKTVTSSQHFQFHVSLMHDWFKVDGFYNRIWFAYLGDINFAVESHLAFICCRNYFCVSLILKMSLSFDPKLDHNYLCVRSLLAHNLKFNFQKFYA